MTTWKNASLLRRLVNLTGALTFQINISNIYLFIFRFNRLPLDRQNTPVQLMLRKVFTVKAESEASTEAPLLQ